jgi:hypothetical protein
MRWIFKGHKNPQRAFLWRGSKAVGPMSYDFTACKQSFRSTNTDISKSKFIISFSKFLLICYQMTTGRIAKELWWANQEFSPVDIIPPLFPCPYVTFGMNSRPVGGCSSETSHPIDIIIMFTCKLI